jgi:hypothetical protein
MASNFAGCRIVLRQDEVTRATNPDDAGLVPPERLYFFRGRIEVAS